MGLRKKAHRNFVFGVVFYGQLIVAAQ